MYRANVDEKKGLCNPPVVKPLSFLLFFEDQQVKSVLASIVNAPLGHEKEHEPQKSDPCQTSH